jgi:hypothetical protein
MLHFFLTFGVPVLCTGVLYLFVRRHWCKRIQELERDLQQLAEEMCEMVEIVMKAHSKLGRNLEDIEERIMDLAVPSHNPDLPLERRHRILALARKGVTLDDIVKRLNVPRGEVEIILSLREYMDSGTPQAANLNEEVRHNVQA